MGSVAYTEIPCDKCGVIPSYSWYGHTSVRLCSKRGCYEYYDNLYREMIEDDDDEH
jgi:hypothetical protein